MEREKLNQIIRVLNNLYIKNCDEEEINKLCELVGINPFTEDTLRQLEESNDLNKIIQEVISSVEESLKLEDEDFFYHELQQRYIPYIGNNKKKLELLNTKITNLFYRTEVIKSLGDDKTKIELLETISDDELYYRVEVIKSLSEDKNKIKLLDIIFKNNKEIRQQQIYIAEIIATFKNDNKKVELLDTLSLSLAKAEVIKSLRNENKRIELLDRVSKIDRTEIVKSLSDDNKKIKLLDRLRKSDRAEVLASLKNDQKKLELLDMIPKSHRKNVIDSFNIDFLKECFSNDELMKKYGMILQDYKFVFNQIERIREVDKKKYDSFELPSQMTIGIEIEAEGRYADILTNKIRKIGKWKLLDEIGFDEIEAISPVMHDTEKDIDEIYKVTNLMKELKFSVGAESQAHVHIGADYLKTVEEWKELLEIWGNAEEIFYLISNPPGQLPIEEIECWASPISKKIEQSNLDKSSKDEFLEDARKVQKERGTSINLRNVNNEKNTIEFRLSNGTLEPDIWIENVRLYGRVVQMAHEISEINKKKQRGEEITEEQENKLQMKEKLKKDVSMDEKMGALMKLLFKEEEREVYEDRYVVNKEAEQQERRLEKMNFGKVHFGNIYDSTEISENIERKLSNVEKNYTRGQTPEIR